MADRGANLDIGFDKRSTQALRISALNVGAIQVADEILGKFHALFLKQQYRGAASGPEETLGTTALKKHPVLNRLRVFVFRFAVALDDITDHEGDDLYHGDPSDTRTAGDIGVDHGHHSFVLGIWRRQAHDRPGVARVVVPVVLIEVADDTGHGSMIVVILLGGEPADDEITAVKRAEPGSLVRTQEFLVFEEFSLQRKVQTYL